MAALLPAAVRAAPAPKLEFSAFEMQLAQTVAGDPGLAAFYGAHELRPVFLGAEAAPRRKALMDAIATAPEHGLPPDHYAATGLDMSGGATDVASEVRFARILSDWANDVSNGLTNPEQTAPMNKRSVIPVDMAALLNDMTTGDPAAALAKLPPQDETYNRLKDMLADQARLIAPAGTPLVAEGLYKPGSEDQAVGDLRARLDAIGFRPDAAPENPLRFDEDLRETVARYQTEAGLPVDGIAGPKTIAQLNGQATSPQTRRLMIAMERMRWLNGHDLNARMIWVNIPSYMAEIREGGQAVFNTRVVVGKADAKWQTPEFSDVMEFVVPNPRWNVPRSIAAESYLSKLRANRYAVSHLDVVDSKGRVIPRENIDFNKYSDRNFPYFLRQKPSPDNALGQVKFMFPNKWNIYLHDTPSKGLFGNQNRAYSHGCVRVARPFDLAHTLLRGNSDNPQALFQRILDTGEEKWVKLADPIPVHLVYFTSIPGPDGQLQTYRDVYGRDALLWSAMQKAAAAGS